MSERSVRQKRGIHIQELKYILDGGSRVLNEVIEEADVKLVRVESVVEARQLFVIETKL